MTVKGGTTPACAACKYQRRKCSPNCPLAPYFPANVPKTFQNVHRLFGVSNVTKTLEKLKTKEEKDDAMTSIIYEAEMRKRYPVHGCCYVIWQLSRQMNFAAEELQNVRALVQEQRDLAAAAAPAAQQQQPGQSSNFWPQFEANDLFPKQEIMMPYFSNSCENTWPRLTLDHHHQPNMATIQQQMDSFSFHEGANSRSRDDFEVICHDNYSSESSLEDLTVVKELTSDKMNKLE